MSCALAASNCAHRTGGATRPETEYDRTTARWETELTSLIGLTGEQQRLASAVKQAQVES